MSLLLNIDTAAEISLVQLVGNGVVLACETNPNRMDHAAFLHPAIARLFSIAGKSMNELDAVAVTEGPGSYTGIRVGMATAKGLCLATGKPLILLNRLWLMAAAMRDVYPVQEGFYGPMMDARRMEVFCALYTAELREIIPPTAHILSTVSFRDEVMEKPLVISGSGAEKFLPVSTLTHLHILPEIDLTKVFATTSYAYFIDGKFANLVDSQPFYAKDFYNG